MFHQKNYLTFCRVTEYFVIVTNIFAIFIIVFSWCKKFNVVSKFNSCTSLFFWNGHHQTLIKVGYNIHVIMVIWHYVLISSRLREVIDCSHYCFLTTNSISMCYYSRHFLGSVLLISFSCWCYLCISDRFAQQNHQSQMSYWLRPHIKVC